MAPPVKLPYSRRLHILFCTRASIAQKIDMRLSDLQGKGGYPLPTTLATGTKTPRCTCSAKLAGLYGTPGFSLLRQRFAG